MKNILIIFVLIISCGADGPRFEGDHDAGTDTTTGSDVDVDVDTDTDADSDTDTDSDTDSDTDIPTSTDTDTDTDTDSDTDTDTDSDIDTDECTGILFESFCWFLGVEGISCDQMCAAHEALYDDATCTFAGSSPLNCEAVFNVLEVPDWPMYECECEGLGCHVLNETRGLSDTCDNSSIGNQTERVCACSF